MLAVDEQIYRCHYTDAGNADALVLMYGDKLRYVHQAGWHVWTGQYWKPDAEKEAVRFVRELARKRQQLIAVYANTDEKDEKFGMATRLENTAKARTCLDMAESTKPFSCLSDKLDTNPMLLTCPNGTIDLTTGQLRVARQDDLITQCTNVNYVPDAECPRWKQFLDEVFIQKNTGYPDFELIDWLKKALGLSLTGQIKERCCFIGHGSGHNGKTTLLNTVNHILGTYAAVTPFANLLLKQSDTATNDIAALRSKRFVSAVEAGILKYLDEVRIKQMTGGDPVTVRFLYHEFFTYQPTYKIWLACNHKPLIRGTDEAIWGRIKMIPFNAYFEKGVNADLDLPFELEAEAEGILSWMIEGCLKWQSEGLLDCDTVKQSNKIYRSEEDAFAHFLSEKIKVSQGGFLATSVIWATQKNWAKDNGEKEIANTTRLGMEMSNRGYRAGTNNNKRGYYDIEFV